MPKVTFSDVMANIETVHMYYRPTEDMHEEVNCSNILSGKLKIPES